MISNRKHIVIVTFINLLLRWLLDFIFSKVIEQTVTMSQTHLTSNEKERLVSELHIYII